MGQIRVEVGGRAYPLACKDGEEATLTTLAARVNEKAERLVAQLGHLPESRLLLMSAIMLADDYVELAASGGHAEPAPAATTAPTEADAAALADMKAATASITTAAAAALDRAAARIETAAAALETAPDA